MNLLDPVASQAVGLVRMMLVERELVLLSVVFVQPAEGSDPQDASTVFMDDAHRIVAETVRDRQVLLVVDEVARVEIETVKAVLGSNPQPAGTVGEDCQHR